MKVLVCGMNGAGKSTLGRALAGALGVPFRDAEDYWFPKDGGYLYERPRTREEVDTLLRADMAALPDVVYAAVRCPEAARFDCAVLVDVPREERMRRIRRRSYGKFGVRMLPGGDLHETEERFFAQCEQRPQTDAEDALRAAGVPFIRVDGIRPVAENIMVICDRLNEKRQSR